jgi:Na+/H+-dicarboxylate symporter
LADSQSYLLVEKLFNLARSFQADLENIKNLIMKFPLYLQIIAALIVATIVGVLLRASHFDEKLIEHLALPCTLILKALRTLATPLIFLAIIHTFISQVNPVGNYLGC